MKRFYKFLQIAAVGAVIAIGTAGCDTDAGSDNTESHQEGSTGGSTDWHNSGDDSGSSTGGGSNTGGNSGGSTDWSDSGSTDWNSSGDDSGSSTGGGSNTGGNSGGNNNTGGNNNGGGAAAVEYRIDQAIFGTCSKSGGNLVFRWTLKTTGKTPNGLYTYTSPSNIVVSVQADGGYHDLDTLAGSARTYTLNNFAAWAADDRVYFRVKCVSGYNETISYNGYRVSVDTFTPNYPRN
jgi:hypothetical protein